jgi:hypothetical protein
MAHARQVEQWCMLGVAVSELVNRSGFAQKRVTPQEIIPKEFHPKPQPPRKKTPAEREAEQRQAWDSFDSAFGAKFSDEKPNDEG